MNLTDYPTPETDAQWPSLRTHPDISSVACTLGTLRDLERRLAACRTLLASLDPYPDEGIPESRFGIYCEITTKEMIAIRQTLTETAPK